MACRARGGERRRRRPEDRQHECRADRARRRPAAGFSAARRDRGRNQGRRVAGQRRGRRAGLGGMERPADRRA